MALDDLTDIETRVLRHMATHEAVLDEIAAAELGLDLETYRTTCDKLESKGFVTFTSAKGMETPQ